MQVHAQVQVHEQVQDQVQVLEQEQEQEQVRPRRTVLVAVAWAKAGDTWMLAGMEVVTTQMRATRMPGMLTPAITMRTTGRMIIHLVVMASRLLHSGTVLPGYERWRLYATRH